MMRSNTHLDNLWIGSGGRVINFRSFEGSFYFITYSSPGSASGLQFSTQKPFRGNSYYAEDIDEATRFGFGISYLDRMGVPLKSHRQLLGISFWWFIVPSGLACVYSFIRRKKWKRLPAPLRREGVCVGCGYDLRMHMAGEKCPECGAVVEAAKGSGGP